MLRFGLGCAIVFLLLITYVIGLFKGRDFSHELLPLIAMCTGFLLGRSRR